MAVSGGATTSYTYAMHNGVATITRSEMRQRSTLDSVPAAAAKLRAGNSATIAAADAPALRTALTGKDAHGKAVQP